MKDSDIPADRQGDSDRVYRVDTKCLYSNKLKLDAGEMPNFPQSNLEFEATFQGRLKQVTISCFVI